MSNSQNGTLAQFFGFDQHGTTMRTELLAGLTTFLTMAYIIVVNPSILGAAIKIPGYSHGQVVQMLAITTILASFVATLIMALFANRPFGLAPGMGSNAFFAFTVVLAMGFTWQTALAAVFTEGVIFILITLFGARRYVIELIPEPVKRSVGAGIGMFLLFLGLQEMNVVVSSKATLVTLGSIASDPVALLAVAGLFLTFVLYAAGVRGSILLGIILTALAGWLFTWGGAVSPGVLTPESLPGAHYDITPLLGAFVSGFSDIQLVPFLLVLFTFFVLDFFSTAGTLIGVSQIAGFLDERGDLPQIERPLMADAIGTAFGAAIGNSTVTTYVESSAGVEQGGRTGMTALVIALLFLLSLFAVPVVGAIPMYASNLALVVVGLIMLRGVHEIDWQDPAWAIPCGLTIVVMPLTFSIDIGLAAGILSYPVVKSSKGEAGEVPFGQWVLAALFVVYFYVRTSGVLG